MGETKRTLKSLRLWIMMAVLVLLNICLFIRAQQSSYYGFMEIEEEQLPVVREEYESLLNHYKDAEFDDAIKEVQELSELSARYNSILKMISVRDILLSSEEGRQQWDLMFANDYDSYQNSYPELFQSLKDGTEELDQEELRIRSLAASKLLVQLQYLDGYDSYLIGIQENAERMKTFSIFNTEGGFSGKNIEQTARDFARLQGIRVKLDNYQGIEAFFNFPITNYLLLFGIFMLVSGFSEGRKAGLWQMLYATTGGRGKLAVSRMMTLLEGIAVICIVLYGSSFLTSSLIYQGTGDLSNPVQSLELFGRVPWNITFWEMLLIFYMFRVFTAFLIGLLFWLILMAFRDRIKLSFVVIILILAVEYILYRTLTDQSALNFLRYVNIFLYIDTGTLLYRYLNLNLFGMAVHIGKAALACGMVLAAVTGGLCVWMEAERYPERKASLFDRILLRVKSIGDRFRSVLTWQGLEYYKILVMNGGVLILIAFFLLMAQADYSVQEYPTMVDAYMEEFAGEITEETWQRVDERRKELQEGKQIYDAAVVAVQAEEISSLEYLSRIEGHENDQNKLTALEQFAAILKEKKTRGQELGEDLFVIYEVPYQMVYGERTTHQRMHRSLLMLMALSLLLAGMMTMEQTSAGLRQAIRSTRGGRSGLLFRKYRVVFGLVFLLWVFSALMEVSTFLRLGDKTAFHVPVQSLTFLSAFPFHISIKGYLALGYLLRLVMLLLTGGLITFLSSKMHRMDAAYLAVCGIIVLPAAFWIYMGIDVFRWMTPAKLIDVFSLVSTVGGHMMPLATEGLIYLLLSGTASTVLIRSWCR